MSRKRVGGGLLKTITAQGRSVAWVARQLGVDRSLIYRWDWGTRIPTPEHQQRVSQLLGVPVEMLFPDIAA